MMILIEKSKAKYLIARKFGKVIISISPNEFFDCLGCIEEDVV